MAPDITNTTASTITTMAIALAKAPSPPKRAYATFLAGNGDYVMGVVGLAKGLRKVKSKYPLVVAILPDVPEDHRKILVEQGCIIKEIEPVYPPDQNQTQFAMAYYVINYSKLRIWEFVEYSKMIYLCGDIQVFDNMDNLFDIEDDYFYAVNNCFCEKTWIHTPQYKIGYCQQYPDKVQWPSHLGPEPPLYFSAGMPIPPIYNLAMAMLWRHPEKIVPEKAKVVHYCDAPWRYTGKEENMDREDIKMLVTKWKDIYNDESILAAWSEACLAHHLCL
ncbi:hypothetical protein PTKIN_Ptkin01aG0303500 [Pterospermum kingtungense]